MSESTEGEFPGRAGRLAIAMRKTVNPTGRTPVDRSVWKAMGRQQNCKLEMPQWTGQRTNRMDRMDGTDRIQDTGWTGWIG